MKLSLIIFLSLLIFTGTAKNHASTEDFSRVFIPVNDEEEEEEKAGNKKIAILHPVVNKVYLDKGISEHQPEAHDGDNDNLKLHKSLQSLREYLEMLNKKKNQKEPSYKEESFEDNGLGPHYHIMYTNEPSIEMLPDELQGEENVGDNPPKDLYFKPIPISDKIGMAERTGKQVGTGGGQRIQETVLLAVSSATLTVLLLLTVFCAAAIYYCTKPYGHVDDFSLTSSEKRALLCPSDSSYRTEDSSLLWNERLITIQGSSDPRQPTFSAYIDEVSTFSDESARTAERDITEVEYRLAPYQATPPSAKAEPPSVPPPAEGRPVPPEEAQLAPPPAEAAPPVLPPDEGVSPQPPSAEGAPPPEAPPPAEGAPPPEAPPPAEGAPPPEAPPPAEGAPPPEAPPPAEGAPPPEAPQAPPAEVAPPE